MNSKIMPGQHQKEKINAIKYPGSKVTGSGEWDDEESSVLGGIGGNQPGFYAIKE